MKVKTGLRAGVTAQDVLQGVGDTAVRAVQTVGGAAQRFDSAARGAVRSMQGAWNRSGIGDTVNKAFWFPLEPPR
jgi:hypothetical protein